MEQTGLFNLSADELKELIEEAEKEQPPIERDENGLLPSSLHYKDIIRLVAETDETCLIRHTHDKELIGKGYFDFTQNINTELLLGLHDTPDFVTFAHKYILDDTLESLLHGSIMLPYCEESKRNITHGQYAVILDDDRILNARACVLHEFTFDRYPTFAHWEIDKRDLTEFDNELNISVVGFSKKYEPIKESYNINNSIYVR